MVDIATQVDALNRPLDELPNIVAKRQASEEALSKLSRLVEQNPGYKAQLVDFEDEKHGEKGLIPKLSPVIDLFNNEVISYSLSERPVMNMVENMLDQAFKKLNPHEHPVLHSDQGWQYRMRRYQNILKEHGVKQSMSRKGNCLDNAVVECFFGTLKSECFYLDEFSNISELKDAVTEYIEYYNSRRISLKLKGLTPIEYRNQTYMPRV